MKFLPLITYAKVDALLQKFDKLTVSAVTPAPVLPPCEVFGLFGYNSVECQLGSPVRSHKQLNYAQYNQGMRPNQKIYNKTPQIAFRQQPKSPLKTQRGTFVRKLFNESIQAVRRT